MRNESAHRNNTDLKNCGFLMGNFCLLQPPLNGELIQFNIGNGHMKLNHDSSINNYNSPKFYANWCCHGDYIFQVFFCI